MTAHHSSSLTLHVSTTASRLKAAWASHRQKRPRLLSAVTGTSGVSTHVSQRKARTHSNSTPRLPTGITSRHSSTARFVTRQAIWATYISAWAFLDGEVRYLSLKKVCPTEAQELFDAAKKAAQHRYATYVRMSKIDYSAE